MYSKIKMLVMLTMALLFTQCSLFDNGCDENMEGMYEGVYDCSFIQSVKRNVVFIVTGTDGDYTVETDRKVGLFSEGFTQDNCGFKYKEGPIGARKEGEMTIEGDIMMFRVGSDGWGSLPCKFEGVRI